MSRIVIKTSIAGAHSFTLGIDIIKENDSFMPYYLYRSALKKALQNYVKLKYNQVPYHAVILECERTYNAHLSEGKTRSGKKFIQIGCKRFVGVNRTRLIRWAKSK